MGCAELVHALYLYAFFGDVALFLSWLGNVHFCDEIGAILRPLILVR